MLLFNMNLILSVLSAGYNHRVEPPGVSGCKSPIRKKKHFTFEHYIYETRPNPDLVIYIGQGQGTLWTVRLSISGPHRETNNHSHLD